MGYKNRSIASLQAELESGEPLTEQETINLHLEESRRELAAAKSFEATRPDFTKLHLDHAWNLYWSAYEQLEAAHDDCTCDPRNPDAPACSFCRAQEKVIPF